MPEQLIPVADPSASDFLPKEPQTSPHSLSGKWIVWDHERRTILASADSYPDLMRLIDELRLGDLTIERAPGMLPQAAERSLALLPGETRDLVQDIRASIPDADGWLDTPNAYLWCEKPRDLINTPREEAVRSLLRGVQSGVTS